MDFSIDEDRIENSFDYIAKELLLNHVIKVNNASCEITEIEFYYFNERKHPDYYTHDHNRRKGEWRLHKQGLDITFDGTKKGIDGGVLIRGLRIQEKYVNGPIRCLREIFKLMGSVQEKNYLQIVKEPLEKAEIIKTTRHLPNKVRYEDYHSKEYRYIKNLEQLSITSKEKESIRLNCSILNLP